MFRAIDLTSELDGAVMRAMFEARKRVFIDLLKWDLPVLADKYELDTFDDPLAEYIVMTDGGTAHVASARLLKTTRPHLLDSLYAELVEGPIPRGDNVREITRFCLDRSLTTRERRQARDWLVSSLVTYALENGITQYTGVAEQSWFEKISDFGWDCGALGPPKLIEGRMLTALSIQIDGDTPALLAHRGIWRDSMPVPAFALAQTLEQRA